MSGVKHQGIVGSGTGGVWRVLGEDGKEYDATLRGRLKTTGKGHRETRGSSPKSVRARAAAAGAAEETKLAVGDRVRIERDVRQRGWAITEILPRQSRLARRAPGGGQGERVVAANVDQVIVMFAAAKPEPHRRMLDRFLVIAEANDLAARVIINKIELVGPGVAHDYFADYERAGYPVHFTSVKQQIGLEGIEAALDGRISVVSGPSGVGKSSLLNALFPGLGLRVAEISESVNKGRHTTVGAYLHPLPTPASGAVVDTPGLREIGMWALPLEQLDRCFPEFREPREQCRFGDCSHSTEPDCAVRVAVEKQQISRARYESYLKLRSEIESDPTL